MSVHSWKANTIDSKNQHIGENKGENDIWFCALYKASCVVCWWAPWVRISAKNGYIGIFGGISFSSVCEAEEDTWFCTLYKALGVVCWWVLCVGRVFKYGNIGIFQVLSLISSWYHSTLNIVIICHVAYPWILIQCLELKRPTVYSKSVFFIHLIIMNFVFVNLHLT